MDIIRTSSTESDELPLPHSIRAEQAVLGALLLVQEQIPIVLDILEEQDFYRKEHRLIFRAIKILYEDEQVVDIISVGEQLEQMQMIRKVGGHGEISMLTTYAPLDSYAARTHARTVRLKSWFRQQIKTFANLTAMAYQENMDTITTALQQVTALESQALHGMHDFHRMDVVASQYIDWITNVYEHPEQAEGVPYGFTDLDKMGHGAQKSDLIIIAARPSVGKTTFSLNIAKNASQMKAAHVAYFSMEMSYRQLFNKMVAMGIPMDSQRLQRGEFDSFDWQRIVATIGDLSPLNMSICDKSSISVQELSSLARVLHCQHPIDLIVVDYLQLLESYVDGKRIMPRLQEVTDISKKLKQLARDLNVPVIALAQLSRAVESRQSKIPQMSDLRESGSIEQDSDIIMFLNREETYNPETERRGILDIVVAKHRNGPVGTVSLRYNPSTSRFEDLSPTLSEEHHVVEGYITPSDNDQEGEED